MKQEKTNTDNRIQDDFLIRGLKKSEVWDHENAFYWFSHPNRLSKLLAHYELYKSISSLPGDIVELGVYKAASLVRLATFRNIIENDFARKIVGFDAFGKFPTNQLSLKADLDFIDRFENGGGDGLEIEEVKLIFQIKNFQNISLLKGNVFETLPDFLESNPATRIALLHLDMDVKEPTEYALDLLYSRVVAGGLIIIDDYNAVAGATDAVDSFTSKYNLKLEKTLFNNVPSFIRKPY